MDVGHNDIKISAPYLYFTGFFKSFDSNLRLSACKDKKL